MRDIQLAPSCCDTIDVNNVASISPLVKTDILFDKTSPARIFSSGKSYFQSFKISPGSDRLYVKSQISDSLGYKMSAVYPMILALNQALEPIAILHPQAKNQSGFQVHAGAKFRLYIVSNLLLPLDTHYVVLFSDNTKFGTSFLGRWRDAVGLLDPRWFSQDITWLPQGKLSISVF